MNHEYVAYLHWFTTKGAKDEQRFGLHHGLTTNALTGQRELLTLHPKDRMSTGLDFTENKNPAHDLMVNVNFLSRYSAPIVAIASTPILRLNLDDLMLELPRLHAATIVGSRQYEKFGVIVLDRGQDKSVVRTGYESLLKYLEFNV